MKKIRPKFFAQQNLTRALSRANAAPMSQDKLAEDQPSFEEALSALEEIVHKLESGEAPLDASISLYERGHELRAQCQARLDAAKSRIDAITLDKNGQAAGTQPFDAE